MQRLDRRLAKLESDSGFNGSPYERMSDAELDEAIVRIYAVLAAKLSPRELEELDCYFLAGLEHEPVLEPWRRFWPMCSDIQVLGLMRTGRTFYDECASLSIEQIEARVNAQVARFAGTSSSVSRAGERFARSKEAGHGQKP